MYPILVTSFGFLTVLFLSQHPPRQLSSIWLYLQHFQYTTSNKNCENSNNVLDGENQLNLEQFRNFEKKKNSALMLFSFLSFN